MNPNRFVRHHSIHEPLRGNRFRALVGLKGIRRLKPEDVNLETGFIFVSADVSKVREPRKVTIQPNLIAWLKAYTPTDERPIGPKNRQHVRARLAKARGFLTTSCGTRSFPCSSPYSVPSERP
jgi:hypothetical protein